MNTRKIIILNIILIVLTLAGCNTEENDISQNSNENITKLSSQTPIDQTLSNNAKEYVLEKKEVTEIRGINTNKDLLIAIKVTQLEQFNEQDLENEIKKGLEKKYPDKTIDVSSDQKIFIELDDLEKKIQKNDVNKKKLQKKFNEIKKLMKEQA